MAAYDRLKILESLKTSFIDVIPYIHYSDRPSGTSAQKDSFMVIRLGDMEDLGAYGESYVNLFLFHRDLNGLERTSKLEDMQKAVLSKLPINNDLFYTERPQLLQGKSDGSGFHYLSIYFDITIK